MKKCIDGIEIELTAEEIAELKAEHFSIPYDERVEARIRERYTLGQELSIQRQRDTKPEEFAEYFAFCEKIKSEERD